MSKTQVNQELIERLLTYVDTPSEVNLCQVIKDIASELEKGGAEVEMLKSTLQQMEENLQEMSDADVNAAAEEAYSNMVGEMCGYDPRS